MPALPKCIKPVIKPLNKEFQKSETDLNFKIFSIHKNIFNQFAIRSTKYNIGSIELLMSFSALKPIFKLSNIEPLISFYYLLDALSMIKHGFSKTLEIQSITSHVQYVSSNYVKRNRFRLEINLSFTHV